MQYVGVASGKTRGAKACGKEKPDTTVVTREDVMNGRPVNKSTLIRPSVN